MKQFLKALLLLSILFIQKTEAQTITSFTPTTGSVGTLVTISGTSLLNATGLSIGGVNAIVLSKTDSILVGMVMPGAVTDSIIINDTISSVDNFTITPTTFPSAQQGAKLVGTGATGIAQQGFSVAISADGNTAIVGGVYDNSNQGAAWMYVRSGGIWTQQGTKLVGSTAIGNAQQGYSVSLSADGNTAIVGGPGDNSNQGAAWIYTRSGNTWTQQGPKLLGVGAIGAARQGYSVSISADGNTALVGAIADNTNQGATWVYIRTGGVWTQQGSKLVGSGAIGAAQQGYSVSISANGNTAIVGGNADNTNQGAVWIFTRSGSTWTQQGTKLTGTGAIGAARQGASVSLSADGNTAIVGGTQDNSGQGAVWVYVRSGSVWTQQGTKLVGTGVVGTSVLQGAAVSLSADGNSFMEGGYGNNSNQGSAWVFTRSGSTWSQQGTKLVGTGAVGTGYQGRGIAISADGNSAIVGGYVDNSSVGAVWMYYSTSPLTNNTVTSNQNKCYGSMADSLTGTLPAGGNDIYTYSWLKSTTNASTGYTVIASINTRNYAPGVLTQSCWFRRVVNSGLFSDTSNVVAITVDPLISNNQILSSQSICLGTTTSQITSTTATGGNGLTYTYSWLKSITSASSGFSVIDSSNVQNYSPGNLTQTTWFKRVVQSGACADTTITNMVTVNSGAPVINNISPLSGAVGTLVTIKGANLLSPTKFNIGGVSAIVVSNTDTALVGLVMPGASTGVIGITTACDSIFSSSIFTITSTTPPNAQQGPKLTGIGASGAAQYGFSVALSGDGNTAIVGGPTDNSNQGAAWVYIRNGNVWTQQGAKLVGTGAVGGAKQGYSVAISADGNTAIVGGYADNSNQGAAWVYTRNGSSWIQQGIKLVGTGVAAATAQQGISVSLSADGNTAVVGGSQDNSGQGAVWVYTRNGNTWAQQGTKLVGTGVITRAWQGTSVSLSADGNTLIVGGYGDNSNQGAAWIYARNGNTWTQQGTKLVGTGAVAGWVFQGNSVAMSADGNTAIVAGYFDNSDQGAVWVFTRNGSVWTQQGTKLLGTGPVGPSRQGSSVSISADGNTLVVGGYADNSNQGAVWIYTRSGNTWTQQGTKIVGTGAVGSSVYQGCAVSISSDGNTAFACGYGDNTNQGAAWVLYKAPPIGNNTLGSNQTKCISSVPDSLLGSLPTGGNGAYTYSWLKSITSASSGFTVVPSINTRNYAPSILTRTSWFRRVVNCGQLYDTSNVVTITIDSVIANNVLSSQIICLGTSASQITSSIPKGGDRVTYTYSWLKSTTSSSSGFSAIDSSNIQSYTPDTLTQTTWYRRIVQSGQCGADTSLPVAIKVYGPPMINSVSPGSGPVGTLVTIRGANFLSPTMFNIGGVNALGISNTDTTIVGLVMPGASTGSIGITTGCDTLVSDSVFTVTPVLYPTAQQGTKMVGTGASGAAQQGYSVDISADGNTAIIGGYTDNSSQGAAWVYTRNGNTWSQQGIKLFGTGASGAAQQGASVSISADGNTAMVGGWNDNSNRGAVWVYTRSGNTWTQQGTKLVGTGFVGASKQGSSISLSADGNTAIVGGFGDDSNKGAVWVFTRSGSVWTQQGTKLVGTGAIGTTARQGCSVSLSGDGKTAIVGGYGDNSSQGAAWVYARSGNVWSQQGTKLVGTGSVGSAQQGFSVSISADGNTAIIGGSNDNSALGAVWVYTRSGSVWTQQGAKLVGTDAVGSITQEGFSVSLSADGNTAIIGGVGDNFGQGATWVFTRIGNVWTQQGIKLVGTGSVGIARQGYSVAVSADANIAVVGGYADNSNQGAVWAYFSTPALTNNTPGVNQTICYGSMADSLMGSIPTGGNGTYTYSWMKSTLNASSGFSVIASINTPNYAPGMLTQTSWYRRIVSCGLFRDTSNAVVITVDSLITNNTLLSSQSICLGTSPTQITSTLPKGGDGVTYNYSWLKSITNADSGFSIIDSSNFQNYTTTNLSQTTWFKRVVQSGTCTDTTASNMIAVNAGSPVVSSFSPLSGPVGTLITIKGSNLLSPSKFKIGGVNAVVVSSTDTSIIGLVMPGASTGVIGITTACDSVESTGVFTTTPTGYPNAQQGAKLIGTGTVGLAHQGESVAISADGNTVVVGGPEDNSHQGAVWIYTRSGNTWSQQGPKLVGSGAIGSAVKGAAVSISADGNTVIVGGSEDNSDKGAAWVFTRNGNIWTQQGSKLVGAGAVGSEIRFGVSVSLSADGNTAIVGGEGDNYSRGAAWVYTRNGNVWTQQGAKLTGTDATTDGANQGYSVSLSADGNTAIVGGYGDSLDQGAAWVYTRSGNVWSQQGPKLVGTGSTGPLPHYQGRSVALSADGNTAIVGGEYDNYVLGAAWVYTRSGNVWTQQGAKLVGTDGTAWAQQGHSVSLSADGNTAIVGGFKDDSEQGAVWIYTRSGNIWTQKGTKLVGTGTVGTSVHGYSVSMSADANTAIAGGFGDNSGAGAAWVYYNSPPITNNILGTNQSKCYGSMADSLIGTLPAGGNETYKYRWLKSTTSASSGFTAIASANSIHYAPGILTQTCWYRRIVICGLLNDTSNAVAINVEPRISNNILSPQSICSGTAASTIMSTTPTGGDGVTYTYSWLKSVTSDSSDFSMISASNIQSYTPDSVTQTTWYKRIVKSGQCWVDTSAPISIKVLESPIINSVSPLSGPIGTLITIRGENFLSPTELNIGGINAIVVSSNDTSIVGLLMPGSSTGVVRISTICDTVLSSSVFSITPTPYPITQQGSKLVGTGSSGTMQQGRSVALSADGNTAIVGGWADNSGQGAAWIYTRSGNTWTQQGAKLVGTGAVGAAQQGSSVSISADGNTAIVGGCVDNSTEGAAWVYVRSGNTWSQQGPKLVGTGGVGTGAQGFSVSLSADGNTAIVGGFKDDSYQGAAWIYTRNGNIWSQHGPKLVGTGAIGSEVYQGYSVSLSADGNTAIVGGTEDNSDRGAAWVYIRNGNAWTQQGSKLVGTGAVGTTAQGSSVSLSADGNTAIVGGTLDNSSKGAAWVFTRNGNTWSQQGAKLVGTGTVGFALQGRSVSLSADGNTAIVGGEGNNSYEGAIWVFTRSGNLWTQQGPKLTGTGAVNNGQQGTSVSLSADGSTTIVGGLLDNSEAGASWVFVSGSTLPVELTQFNSLLRGKSVLNEWQTASELNNDYFEVERSLDNQQWLTLGKIKGKGTSNMVSKYEFTDNMLPTQLVKILYYRLKQVDFDGAVHYSKVNTIVLDQPTISVQINPNPYHDHASLVLQSATESDIEITITNISGIILSKQDASVVSGLNSIELQHIETLPHGMYFVLIKQGTQTTVLKLLH